MKMKADTLEQWSPSFLAPGTSFVENNFSMDQEWGEGFRMIQPHCIYCAFYFYHCYFSSTSDHQTLDPEGWVSLPQRKISFYYP